MNYDKLGALCLRNNKFTPGAKVLLQPSRLNAMTVTAPMEVKPRATDVTRDTERGRDTQGLQLSEPESYWCSETVTQHSRQGSSRQWVDISEMVFLLGILIIILMGYLQNIRKLIVFQSLFVFLVCKPTKRNFCRRRGENEWTTLYTQKNVSQHDRKQLGSNV